MHTPDTKYSHIKFPYLETTVLHSKLTNPSAPMAWLIWAMIAWKEKLVKDVCQSTKEKLN